MQNKKDFGIEFIVRIVSYERIHFLSRMRIACSIWSMGLWINGNWIGYRISSGHVRTALSGANTALRCDTMNFSFYWIRFSWHSDARRLYEIFTETERDEDEDPDEVEDVYMQEKTRYWKTLVALKHCEH
jgi:hypothetical protein